MLSNHRLICWLTDRSDKVNDAVDILLAPPGRDDERIVTWSSWAAGRGVWQLKAFFTLQVRGGSEEHHVLGPLLQRGAAALQQPRQRGYRSLELGVS